MDAVKTYLVTGSLAAVSKTCEIPYDTVRKWHIQEWWKEVEENLRMEDSFELSAKLRSRINRALDITLDRLENGDFIYDPRTGGMVRKPVSLRDANKAMTDWIAAKNEVDSLPAARQNQQAVVDTLAKLTEQFAKMASEAKSRKRPYATVEGEVTNVEVIEDTSKEGLDGEEPKLP